VHQLAVVHSATAEGRLRHIGLAAVFRNLAQDFVVFHRAKSLGQAGGQRRIARLSYHHLPTLGNAGDENWAKTAHSVSSAGESAKRVFALGDPRIHQYSKEVSRRGWVAGSSPATTRRKTRRKLEPQAQRRQQTSAS
jgi:hypothetical protein